MEEFLSKLTPHLAAVLAILGGTIIAVVAIISCNWRRARQTEVEASLKQEMLTRGMSAQDIERVIKATGQAETPKADAE